MSADTKGDNLAIEGKDSASVVEDTGHHDTEKGTARNALHVDPERRAQIEKRLKLKLDARNSVFLLVYIMNYL